MAKLTTKARKKVPAKEFGEPRKCAYPMPDKAHAANAKARAAQRLAPLKWLRKASYRNRKKGRLTPRQTKNLAPKQSSLGLP
jgi:hypothetical protein